jgi:alpha-tubulin suppressor-like RCC1 family protein
MAWGRNDFRQLGTGSNAPDRHPIPVEVVGLQGVKAIAAGCWHSMALLEDGTVWTWGHNGQGQLGNGTTVEIFNPVMVSNLKGVTAIAAGIRHCLALLDDGTVWAWGNNNVGQLGDGTNTARSTPVRVMNIANVKAISAGHTGEADQSFCMALLNDGTVWAWGYNDSGQLGDGTYNTSNKPTEVSNLAGTAVKAIAAGGWHAVALLQDGSIWTWGRNQYGQLGDGTNTNRNRPGKVVNVTGIKVIDAGAVVSFAFG